MLLTENNTLFYCDTFRISIDSEQIITVAISENHAVTLDEVKTIYKIVNDCAEKYGNCTLLTYGGSFTSIDPDAREYSQKQTFKVQAHAYLVNSLAQRIIMRFLAKMRAKKMSIQLFECEHKAKKWLVEQRNLVKVA